jgi:phosphopantothenoylcysteine decarboxylase/phosphopantothenate--cysteine ligase
MNILITAGPTREPIDPVRFISNRSSGKMGYAVADAAARRGHKVILISGPVSLKPPRKVKVVEVQTAVQMLGAVRKHLRWCHALVMAAAVADWRPAEAKSQKMKKNAGIPRLRLKPTPDILKTVSSAKGTRLFVGFAAETRNLLPEARRKLIEKKLDLIVANNVSRRDSGFDVDTNKVTFILPDGDCQPFPLLTKKAVALQIIRWLESRLSSRP